MTTDTAFLQKLDALIEVLNRMAPPVMKTFNLDETDCFVWMPDKFILKAILHVNRIDIDLIKGVDHVRDILLNNTRRFAKGLPANNVLLWGARGMGKSSLVKAAQLQVNQTVKNRKPLKLIEIHREDITSLPILMSELKKQRDYRFVLFCDDLSFDTDDTSYKSLKAALDGGIEGRPENVILYATSNRRHLMLRDMVDNEQSTAINPTEAIEEKVSLSDRFGLWLGFHKCSQEDYLAMIDSYIKYYNLAFVEDIQQVYAEALEWATTRGNRSGRVAWQFVQDLAGRTEKV